MTKEQKAKKGARCHVAGNCKKCPYRLPVDIMLDPRIDPDFGAHAMERAHKCRDDLIADLAAFVTRDAQIKAVYEVYHNEDGAFIGFGTCESIHVTDEIHTTKKAAEAAKERLEKTGGHCFYYVAKIAVGQRSE